MAVDTENKRRSAPDFFPFVIAPVPDGTIGAADREQATGIYSGIPLLAPITQTVIGMEDRMWSPVFGGLVVR